MFTVMAALLLAKASMSASEKCLPIPPPKHGGVYVVAHRGVHDGIAENTLAAYRKGIELGVDYVEIDTRTTKDGRIVSVHNDTIDSYVPGKKGRIRDFTFDELRAMDIGSRVGPQWKDEKIPELGEILDTCKGKVGIYIDLKDAAIPQVAAELKKRNMEHEALWYISGLCVCSLHKECPECIEMPDPGIEMLLPALLATVSPRVVAGTWKNCSKSFAEKCHEAHAILIVDDGGPETWQKLVDWGTDGIQTNEVAALIKFLDERSAKQK